MSETQTVGNLKTALGVPENGVITPFDSEFVGEASEPTQQPVKQGSNHPSQATDELRGLSKEELGALKGLVHEYQSAQAAQAFISVHGPQGDGLYEICETNTALMFEYMNQHKLDPARVDSYEVAFNALAEARENGTEPAPPSNRLRVPRKAEPVQHVSTGLSDTGNHPDHQIDPDNMTQVAERLQSLPLDQARQEMTKLMRQAAGRR